VLLTKQTPPSHDAQLPPRALPAGEAWVSASSSVISDSNQQNMSDLESFHDYFTPAQAPLYSGLVRPRPPRDSLLEDHSSELPSEEKEQALHMMEEALEIMNVRRVARNPPPPKRMTIVLVYSFPRPERRAALARETASETGKQLSLGPHNASSAPWSLQRSHQLGRVSPPPSFE